MKIIKISASSSCGSYFMSYLQSVTVIAENNDDALKVYKKWAKENNSFEKRMKLYFIHLSDLGDVKIDKKVIDSYSDSDY